MTGADAYLKAMMEAAEDGEAVDWSGVFEALEEGLAAEQPQRLGCFAVGRVEDGAVVIETGQGTFVNGQLLPAER